MRKPAQAVVSPTPTPAPAGGVETAQNSAAPEAAKLPAPVAEWKCALSELPGAGATLAQFTVGAKYALKCEGPTITPWTKTTQFYFSEPEKKFSLHVLETKFVGANAGEFVVTGYKAGNYEVPFVDLGDGQTLVRIKDLKWSVQTVVEAKEGQPPQPFPAIGPFALSVPWWFWASLAGVVLVILAFVQWRVRRTLARKRLIERLAQHGNPLTPYIQFNKDLRSFMRRYHGRASEEAQSHAAKYLAELEKSLRTYITHELLIPALEWSDKEVLRDLRKRHRLVYRETGVELKRLMAEVDRAKSSAKISLTDCDQLHEMSRNVIDHIHLCRREVKR